MRILGIDPGSYSIKILEIETAFRSFQVLNHYEIPLGPDPDTEEVKLTQIQAEAVSEFIYQKQLDGAKLIWSLDQKDSTFRTIDFPYNKRMKILKSLPFQLMDSIPYDVDDCALDFQVFPFDKQSRVTCGIIPKDKLTEIIESLSNSSIDPQIITVPMSLYRILLDKLQEENFRDSQTGLLDIGHRSSKLYLYNRGIAEVVAVSGTAGSNITFELSKKYDISLPAAETLKREKSFILTKLDDTQEYSKEQIEFSDNIKLSLKNLCSDMKHALVSYRGKTGQSINRIYICGGTSQIPGLSDFLKSQFKTPVTKLDLSPLRLKKIQGSNHYNAVTPLAVAAALTQSPKLDFPTLNFRKGDFSKKGTRGGFNLEDLAHPLARAFILIFLVYLSAGLLSIVRSDRKAKLEGKLKKVLRTSPQLLTETKLKPSQRRKFIASPDIIIEKVEKKLKAEKRKSNFTQGGTNNIAKVLNNLSGAVSRNVKVDLTQLETNGNHIKLTASFPNRKQGENFIKSLSSRENFKIIEKKLNGPKSGKANWAANLVMEVE